jgi:hypothetical protein
MRPAQERNMVAVVSQDLASLSTALPVAPRKLQDHKTTDQDASLKPPPTAAGVNN